MSDIKELHPVQLSIEANTRLLLVKQGDNTVKLTRDDVNALRRLRKGEYESNVYTSQIVPKNRCQVSENGYISIVCKDDYESSVVIIANHKKLDDLQRILDYVDKNKGRIAWAREFRGRW